MSGERFNKIVISRHINASVVEFKCDCGTVKKGRKYDILLGKIQSCGCIAIQMLIDRNKLNCKRGGMTHTATGRSWRSLMTRCYNKNSDDYAAYGATGKFACEAIRSGPNALIELIGERPEGKSIDRIDGTGSYTCGRCAQCVSGNIPMNVRWATPSEQTRNQATNRILTINGISKCLADWAVCLNMPASVIRCRLRRGKTGEELIAPINRNHRYITVFSQRKRACEWARIIGIGHASLISRVTNGWTDDEIIKPPMRRLISK